MLGSVVAGFGAGGAGEKEPERADYRLSAIGIAWECGMKRIRLRWGTLTPRVSSIPLAIPASTGSCCASSLVSDISTCPWVNADSKLSFGSNFLWPKRVGKDGRRAMLLYQRASLERVEGHRLFPAVVDSCLILG